MKKLYDLKTIYDLASGDETFVRKMVSLFINDTPDTINAMQEAFKNWDYDELKKISHRIKPIIKTLEINSIINDVNDIDNGNDAAHTERKLNHITAVLSEVILGLKNDLGEITLSSSSQTS